jgi:hypothetical protein
MKIRSLLLGSVAASGLATCGHAADLGIVTSLDILDLSDGFQSYLLGASFGTLTVAMTPDGLAENDSGGHQGSGDYANSDQLDLGLSGGSGTMHHMGGSDVSDTAINNVGGGLHGQLDLGLDAGGHAPS